MAHALKPIIIKNVGVVLVEDAKEALPDFGPWEYILKACEPLHPLACYWHAHRVSI